MVVHNRWRTLPDGFDHSFSPSGHAIAFRPISPFSIQTLRIDFLDGRESLVREVVPHVQPLVWTSDLNLIYRTFGSSHDEKSMLFALSITSGRSEKITEINDTIHASWHGISGHISVLTGSEGKNGLYDLDTYTGSWKRLAIYDKAFEHLLVYPQFGHSWSPRKEEVALIAWPFDYLEAGVKPNENNSQWLPILDTPSIQNAVMIKKDGGKTTQAELAHQAKERKPPRLFLLNNLGEFRDVPGTSWANHPLWSADGNILSFKQYVRPHESLWLIQRDNLERHQVVVPTTHIISVMHPNGILYYKLGNQTGWNMPSIWQTLLLEHGEAMSI